MTPMRYIFLVLGIIVCKIPSSRNAELTISSADKSTLHTEFLTRGLWPGDLSICYQRHSSRPCSLAALQDSSARGLLWSLQWLVFAARRAQSECCHRHARPKLRLGRYRNQHEADGGQV